MKAQQQKEKSKQRKTEPRAEVKRVEVKNWVPPRKLSVRSSFSVFLADFKAASSK